MAEEGERLSVVVADGGMRSIADSLLAQIEIDPARLSKNLNAFIAQMDSVLSETPDMVGGYKLTEMEVSLEINAEGQIVLWGVGGHIGGTGGLSLTFKREDS